MTVSSRNFESVQRPASGRESPGALRAIAALAFAPIIGLAFVLALPLICVGALLWGALQAIRPGSEAKAVVMKSESGSNFVEREVRATAALPSCTHATGCPLRHVYPPATATTT